MPSLSRRAGYTAVSTQPMGSDAVHAMDALDKRESPTPRKKDDADAEEVEVTSAEAAGDAEAANLTLLERKTLLLNRALADMGMGRYQWCIFCLCGFGYALDLIWAQAFGLVTPRIQQELGISNAHYGDIFSVFSAGLTVGAFTWGILVDVVGRKLAFNCTVGITGAFGLFLGAPSSWTALCALAFFVGFGLGGNIPIDATIVLEVLPHDKRWLLAALSVFQPIGVIITSVVAWGLIPNRSCDEGLPACGQVTGGTMCCTKSSNYGWRNTLFTLGGISAAAFVARYLLFDFQESPAFLLSKGKDGEAVEVIRHIAEFNKRECMLRVEDLQTLDAEYGNVSSADEENAGGASGKKKSKFNAQHLKGLFETRARAFLTLLTWVCYMADYWGFSIAGAFLPKILAERGADDKLSTSETYRNYIIIAVAGVPGVLAGAGLIEIRWLGRKWAMVMTSALMAASLFAYAGIRTTAASVGFNAMEYFFQSSFNAILYGWTPEAFPAPIRGSASGLASFWGRLSSVVAPLIAARIASSTGAIYLAGGGVFLCTLTAVFFPETSGMVEH